MSQKEMASQPVAWVPKTRAGACQRRAGLALLACSPSLNLRSKLFLGAVSPWFACVLCCLLDTVFFSESVFKVSGTFL